MSITSPTAAKSVWGIAPAWTLFHERSEKSLPTDVHLTPSQNYGVLPQDEYMKVTGNRVVLNLTGSDNMKRVEPGDFIIHLRSFQGGLELSRINGKVSNAYTVLRPSPMVSVEYFRHFLKSNVFVEELASQTDQLRDGQSVNFSRFSRLSLPLPPLEEQRRIAAFLDRETGEMDDMVTKLDQLIATLSERHVALIEDSVSDESWPQAPSWAMFRDRKERGRPSDQHLTPSQTHGVLPQAEYMSVTGNRVVLNLTGTDSMRHVEPGDFIIHLRSFQGGLELSRVPGKVSPAYTVLQPADSVDPEFFRHYFKSQTFISGLVSLTDQLRDGQSISYSRFSLLSVPVPPFGDQRRIADHLDRETAEIDSMITDAQKLKSLIAERRSALITAVVTGQKEV